MSGAPRPIGAARPRRPRAVVAGALAAGLALVTATACATEAERSPLADGPPAGESAAGETGDGTGTMAWAPCGDLYECAELEVPVDYDEPDGPTLPISVLRAPATGDRLGSLFVNPGGPGGTADDFAAALSRVLPEEITSRFDVVGVNPRGLGASDIDCGGDFAELYGVDYSLDSSEDAEELVEVSQDYVDGCEQAAGDLLPHLGTADVARDIDAVRAAMGDERLNYLGFSYGTAIGQLLAELFPERVRAMVIDGIVELDGGSGEELAAEQAVGFERALDAFAEDCDSDPSCPIGPDARDAVEELVAAVEEEPIPSAGRDVGPGEVGIGLAGPLYSESEWPALANAVADALDGDGTGMLALAEGYLSIADFDVYFAVNCIDFAWPETPEELFAAAADATDEAPIFAEPIVNDYVRCPLWPVEAEPIGEVTAAGLSDPILVVSTTGDPATPHEAAESTVERLEDAVLLTYDGEGHGVVGTGIPCVDDAVVAYLVDLQVPDEGTVC